TSRAAFSRSSCATWIVRFAVSVARTASASVVTWARSEAGVPTSIQPSTSKTRAVRDHSIMAGQPGGSVILLVDIQLRLERIGCRELARAANTFTTPPSVAGYDNPS